MFYASEITKMWLIYPIFKPPNNNDLLSVGFLTAELHTVYEEIVHSQIIHYTCSIDRS